MAMLDSEGYFARVSLCALCLTAAGTLMSGHALAQAADEPPELSIELIDPKVLRVCADPHNMPFSTDRGEGFENKLAELLAGKLGKSLAYAWYPQATGFVRNTLGAHKCDVMMGVPQGSDLVQVTNPYYRSAYALVFKQGSGLEGADTLGDARLKDKRMGVVAGTPPGNNLAAHGLMAKAKPYPLVVDTRVESAAVAMQGLGSCAKGSSRMHRRVSCGGYPSRLPLGCQQSSHRGSTITRGLPVRYCPKGQSTTGRKVVSAALT